MKICLIMQRNFAKVAHAFALSLKENYGFQDFCGYVCSSSSYVFLQKQKDIKYSSLLFDDAVHKKYHEEKIDLEYLRWLEKEYGLPNLWPYIMIDRVIRFNQGVREYP